MTRCLTASSALSRCSCAICWTAVVRSGPSARCFSWTLSPRRTPHALASTFELGPLAIPFPTEESGICSGLSYGTKPQSISDSLVLKTTTTSYSAKEKVKIKVINPPNVLTRHFSILRPYNLASSGGPFKISPSLPLRHFSSTSHSLSLYSPFPLQFLFPYDNYLIPYSL